jgi:hypothetical protein
MCAAVLKAAAAAKGVLVRLKEVHASRGKSQRAEPIAAIYETGRVVHVGHFDELEDELCQFTDQGYAGPRSPNRADACIWACSEFFGRLTQDPERRDRPPPRVLLSRGASRQLGLPQVRTIKGMARGVPGRTRSGTIYDIHRTLPPEVPDDPNDTHFVYDAGTGRIEPRGPR